MSKALQGLTKKLKQFQYTLQLVRKLVTTGDGQKNFQKIDKHYQRLAILAEEIDHDFRSTKNRGEENLTFQKFQINFKQRLEMYQDLLKAHEKKAKQELIGYRQTIRMSMTKPTHDDDEDSEQGPRAIEMQEVHQETLFYENMIELKEKELLEIRDKMQNALKVQTDMGKMVKDQGEKLDIIEDNVDTARTNVKEAEVLLEEGKKHHISANKKKICIFVGVTIILVIIIVPIVVFA